MYQYIYVECHLESTFQNDNHREIINKYSLEGWRFVTVIPTRAGGYGQLTTYDLVFEREL